MVSSNGKRKIKLNWKCLEKHFLFLTFYVRMMEISVIIDKKYLFEEQLKCLEQEPIEFDIEDPF